MPQNFIECGREQAFLMPPSLREWLPEDHLAWFVVDAVEEMDLDAFYADYRADGHGAAAYEPSMMIALLLYAYATKQRSSRAIELHCRQDIAYRVVTANRVPDHATIARFVGRHEAALAGLFGSVLALCAKAGLVKTGVVAIDGTKLHANASREANADYARIAREIVAEAKATDEAEDRLYGEARGDELPEQLRTREGRRRWLAEAKRELEQGEQGEDEPAPADEPPSLPRGRAKDQGRRGWHREARHQLDERRAREAKPIPRAPGTAGGVEAPPRGATRGRALRERGLRALPGTGKDAQRAALRRPAEALRAGRDPDREAQIDRPRLPPDEGGGQCLPPGLQRPGRDQRAPDRRRRGDQRRRSRLLAPRADGRARRGRDPGPDPARLRQAKGQPPRLAGRPLRLDAPGARHRARRAPLPKTLTDGRADVRTHQAQPGDGPLAPTRQIGRADRVAPDHRHSQPDEAP